MSKPDIFSHTSGAKYVKPNIMMIMPLITCQERTGISISRVDAFSRRLKTNIDALSPAIIKNGLLEREPSELRASRIGKRAITQGAKTDSAPAKTEIKNKSIIIIVLQEGVSVAVISIDKILKLKYNYNNMEMTPKSIIVSGAELPVSVGALGVALDEANEQSDRALLIGGIREDLKLPSGIYQAAIDSKTAFCDVSAQIPIELAGDFADGLTTLRSNVRTLRPTILQAFGGLEKFRERKIWNKRLRVIRGMSSFMKKNLPELQLD